MALYLLTIYDDELSYDECRQGFFIGTFSSAALAEQTAQEYLSGVPGFRDYLCSYNIVELPFSPDDARECFLVEGWDENPQGDEIHIVLGGVFPKRPQALAAMQKLRPQRSHWCVNRYKIDCPEWREGFERG